MATSTALQVITRAMRRINIVAEAEAPSADQGADALDTLNEMLSNFNTRGIQYVHQATLTLADVLNVPDEQVRNVMLMLCWELADEYARPISASMDKQVTDAKNALQAHYYNLDQAQADPGLEPIRWDGVLSLDRFW